MGLLDKFGKKDTVLQQDTDDVEKNAGVIFMVHILMDHMCEMPDREQMVKIMNKHLGETECFQHDSKLAAFCPQKYHVHFQKENKDIPPQLLIMGCNEISKPIMDEVAMSQLWDCPDGAEILASCPYQVVATDMLAGGLAYRERAEMLVDYIEALVELYPACKAIVVASSKKMLTRDAIIHCTIPKEDRFLYYAVNVRFFNVGGTADKLVDSIGMSSLFLPDLQYHFHDMDPNAVVNHAYNVLSYIYDNDNPIQNGDHIDGILDGQISPQIQWNVQYEKSLIQPIREVIDVNMGEYASGIR